MGSQNPLYGGSRCILQSQLTWPSSKSGSDHKYFQLNSSIRTYPTMQTNRTYIVCITYSQYMYEYYCTPYIMDTPPPWIHVNETVKSHFTNPLWLVCLSSAWVSFRRAVLWNARFRSGVTRHWPQWAVPPGFTLFGLVGLIAWLVKRPSLGDYRRNPRYFCKCQARVGSDPEPRPTLKKALYDTCPFSGVRNK